MNAPEPLAVRVVVGAVCAVYLASIVLGALVLWVVAPDSLEKEISHGKRT